VLLTRSPLVYPQKGLTARLACVKHAASVRPEPGSNSPTKTGSTKTTSTTPQPRGRDHTTRAHQNWHHTTSSTKNKLDTLLSSQKTPAHHPPTDETISGTGRRAPQEASTRTTSGATTTPYATPTPGTTPKTRTAPPQYTAETGTIEERDRTRQGSTPFTGVVPPASSPWPRVGRRQDPDRRKILSPSQTSGSNLRSTTRSLSGMSALSVILMCSGQTSVQHLVMLQ
jgi:hypothetical protein